jgi:hypothetical protein
MSHNGLYQSRDVSSIVDSISLVLRRKAFMGGQRNSKTRQTTEKSREEVVNLSSES